MNQKPELDIVCLMGGCSSLPTSLWCHWRGNMRGKMEGASVGHIAVQDHFSV